MPPDTPTPSPTPAPSVATPSADPSPPPWASERIDTLTKNWRDEQRAHADTKGQLDLAQRALEELRTRSNTPPAQGLTQADVEKRASELAEKRAQKESFDKQCNDCVAAGRKEFPNDFDARVEALRRSFGVVEGGQVFLPTPLVQAALATGEGHKVLYELGGDMTLANRIMGLTPLHQAAELAKILAKKAEAPPSQVPPPIDGKALSGQGKVEKSPDDMTTREWMEWREAQLRKKAG